MSSARRGIRHDIFGQDGKDNWRPRPFYQVGMAVLMINISKILAKGFSSYCIAHLDCFSVRSKHLFKFFYWHLGAFFFL